MAHRKHTNCRPGMHAAQRRVDDAWFAYGMAQARRASADELATLLADCRAAEAARDALYIRKASDVAGSEVAA